MIASGEIGNRTNALCALIKRLDGLEVGAKGRVGTMRMLQKRFEVVERLFRTFALDRALLLLLGRGNAGFGLIDRGIKAGGLATELGKFAVDRREPALCLRVVIPMGAESDFGAFCGKLLAAHGYRGVAGDKLIKSVLRGVHCGICR